MKKDLIEWGVVVAIIAPVYAYTWILTDRNWGRYVLCVVSLIPIEGIVTKVIMRVMGWDK